MGSNLNTKNNYQLKLIEHIYSQVPAFSELFTEEAFYMCVVTVVTGSIVLVFILSRFVTIKPVD